MNKKINIREANKSDIPTIVIFNELLALESEGISLDRTLLEKGVASAIEDPTKGRYFLAEITESGIKRVSGQLMITLEWSDWRNSNLIWIQSVYVQDQDRRLGVFRSLYNHIKDIAEASLEYCGIRLYVHDDNQLGINTYLKMGLTKPGYSVLETKDQFKPD